MRSIKAHQLLPRVSTQKVGYWTQRHHTFSNTCDQNQYFPTSLSHPKRKISHNQRQNCQIPAHQYTKQALTYCNNLPITWCWNFQLPPYLISPHFILLNMVAMEYVIRHMPVIKPYIWIYWIFWSGVIYFSKSNILVLFCS